MWFFILKPVGKPVPPKHAFIIFYIKNKCKLLYTENKFKYYTAFAFNTVSLAKRFLLGRTKLKIFTFA